MRHLFAVHSGITSVAAYATIQQRGLSSNEVDVLVTRPVDPPDGYMNHVAGEPLRLGRNFVRFRNQLRCFDRRIAGISRGSELAVYLPGLFTEQFYAMATHPSVVEVNLIEEGLSSLTNLTRRYARRTGGNTWLAKLGALGRFPDDLTPCEELLDHAYYFSDGAFPDWPDDRRTRLAWPEPNASSGQSCRAIVSVEMFVEVGAVTLDEYVTVLNSVLATCRERGLTPIGVKFHPNVTAANREQIASRISGVDVFLPNTLTMESILGPAGPTIVAGSSAVLHYAVTSGGQGISYIDHFGNPSLRERFNRFMPNESRARIELL